MNAFKRAFWFVVASIILIEAWLWDLVQPFVQRLVAALPLRKFRALLRWTVARLPAWAVLLVMGLPGIVLLPAKIAGLWLFAHGYFLTGGALFLAAKSVGMVLIVFLFELCRPKLMELVWFARVYGWFSSVRAWAHLQTEPARRLILQFKARALGTNPTFSRRIAALRRWSRPEE